MAIESGRQITVSLYEQAGGARGILRGHLDRVIQREVPAALRPNARRLIEALVTADKRRALRTIDDIAAELAPYGVTEEDVNTLTHTLVDSRLLSVGEGDNGNLAFELAHDYLLEEIELDPDVQARKTAKELLVKKLPYYLSNGILLNEAELAIISAQYKWLALSRDEDRLIQDSRRAIDRRRLLLYALGTAIVSVIVCSLVMILLLQTWSAQDLRVANLTSDANALLAQQQLALARTAQADQELALAEAEVQRANAEAERAAAEAARLEALAAQQEAEANLATARAAEAREAEQRALAEGNLDEAERQRRIAEEQEALANVRRAEAEVSRAEAAAQANIAQQQAAIAQQQANFAATARAEAELEANANATAQAIAELNAQAAAQSAAQAQTAAAAEATSGAIAKEAATAAFIAREEAEANEVAALVEAIEAAWVSKDVHLAYSLTTEAYELATTYKLDLVTTGVRDWLMTLADEPLPRYEIAASGIQNFLDAEIVRNPSATYGSLVVKAGGYIHSYDLYDIGSPTPISHKVLRNAPGPAPFAITESGSYLAFLDTDTEQLSLYKYEAGTWTLKSTIFFYSITNGTVLKWNGNYLTAYENLAGKAQTDIFSVDAGDNLVAVGSREILAIQIYDVGQGGSCAVGKRTDNGAAMVAWTGFTLQSCPLLVAPAIDKSIKLVGVNPGGGITEPVDVNLAGGSAHPTSEYIAFWGDYSWFIWWDQFIPNLKNELDPSDPDYEPYPCFLGDTKSPYCFLSYQYTHVKEIVFRNGLSTFWLRDNGPEGRYVYDYPYYEGADEEKVLTHNFSPQLVDFNSTNSLSSDQNGSVYLWINAFAVPANASKIETFLPGLSLPIAIGLVDEFVYTVNQESIRVFPAQPLPSSAGMTDAQLYSLLSERLSYYRFCQTPAGGTGGCASVVP